MKSNVIIISAKLTPLVNGKNQCIKYCVWCKCKNNKKDKEKEGIYWAFFWEIDLPKTASRYTISVFPKSCYEDGANIIVYDTASAINDVPSWIILACMCINTTTENVSWGMNQYNILKTSKKSVITKTSNHNNSTDLYYAYGNKGNFWLINNSSVSQRTYKKNPNPNSKHNYHSLTITSCSTRVLMNYWMVSLKWAQLLLLLVK